MGKVIFKDALVKTAKGLGWKGATLPELKQWMDDEGREFVMDGETVDVEKSWAKTKTVTISVTADAGEDVVVEDGASEMEGESMDGEEEPMPKGGRRAAFAAERGQKDFRKTFASTIKAPAVHGSDTAIAKRKAYTAAAQRGGQYRGAKCVYSDGDRAEYAGALIRMVAYGPDTGAVGQAYAKQKRFDAEILGKTGSIQSATSYGNMVIEEYLPELIELFPEYGAARQVATVTPMSRDTLTVHKWGTDVTVYDVGETDEITASDGASSNVSLVAKKTAALVKNSSEILNDSALDISNIISRSIARAIAKWEDESYFNGDHNRAGLETLIDANSTYDAGVEVSSTSWAGHTTASLQAWKAKLAGWALESANLALVCHPSFYEAVLKVRAYSAGGTPGDAILNGTRVRAWDGVPVVFSHIMPSAYSADQIVAYIGAFDMATKFGVVRGSEQIATSDQRFFENDIVAMRYTQRWAINCHEVSGTNTGVVALKD